MAGRGNPIFDRLCADSDDIESLVAYALYKKHKRDWAENYRKTHGSDPKTADDDAFASAVSTDGQLQLYRQNAQNLIIAFADQMVEEVKPDIEKEAITARIEAATAKISGAGSFAKQMLSGLTASLITTFVLIILTIASALFGVDPIDGLNELVGNSSSKDISAD
ncbi:hypothetical protein [Gemmobacter serpentinus]|uniref:hypothetical protein n=1 Tax=Gemmobacter serpentinus TaxID=2652247 RepID=UPI00124CB86C|nr:hypothetical protein [Gemmobacter serpentinus]